MARGKNEATSALVGNQLNCLFKGFSVVCLPVPGCLNGANIQVHDGWYVDVDGGLCRSMLYQWWYQPYVVPPYRTTIPPPYTTPYHTILTYGTYHTVGGGTTITAVAITAAQSVALISINGYVWYFDEEESVCIDAIRNPEPVTSP